MAYLGRQSKYNENKAFRLKNLQKKSKRKQGRRGRGGNDRLKRHQFHVHSTWPPPNRFDLNKSRIKSTNGFHFMFLANSSQAIPRLKRLDFCYLYVEVSKYRNLRFFSQVSWRALPRNSGYVAKMVVFDP